MRIGFILLFVNLGSLCASNIYAQEAEITMKYNSIELKNALAEIETQTEFSFVYDSHAVNVDRRVSVNISKDDIFTTLDQLFKNTQISYKVLDRKIILTATVETKQQQQQQSQDGVLTGLIIDVAGLPIIGATVIEKGTTNGVISDVDGKFSLKIAKGLVLQISYIGYTTQEIKIEDQKDITITLKEDSKLLDEIVVVGYGTQKKVNLTGAITVVDMEKVLGERPVINAMSALQGAVAGLTISGGSSPGQKKTFSIRGDLSINGGSPLVLIDNVPGDIDMVNAEDIASITVLKDASSAAIYGARAAGGVILVTTKKPKAGSQFVVNYSNNFGWEQSINRPSAAPAVDMLTGYLDAGFQGGNYFAQSQDVAKWREYLIGYQKDPSQYETVGDGIYIVDGKNYYLNEKDLYENGLELGFLMTHNLSVSGGTEDVQYRMSAGYNSEDGPLLTNKDSFSRTNIGAYVSAKMTDWFTQQIDMRYANATKEMPIDVSGMLYNTRYVTLYPEGIMPASATNGLTDRDLPINTPRNILLDANTSNTKNDDLRIFSKSTFNFFKGFDAVFEYTYNKKNYDHTKYDKQWTYNTIQLNPQTAPIADKLVKDKRYTDYNAINAYATYSKELEGHNFKLMAGFNQEWEYHEELKNEALTMISQTLPSFVGSVGIQKMVDKYSEFSIRSGFFRLNYDYNGKYLLEVSGRYDGSSKFPKENRFGFFPSASAGWNIARESFMADMNWVQELKLRTSWGQIGNQKIDPYKFSPSMATGQYEQWLIDGAFPSYIQMPGLVSQLFTWETVQTLDLAIDFALLDSRLTGTVGLYQRDTKGMLTKGAELPGVLGASAPLENAADMRTRGWEAAINWRHQMGDFGYNVGFNISDYLSEITKFDNESGILEMTNDDDEKVLEQNYIGRNFGEIWGYRADGYYTVDDFEDTNTWKLKDGVTSIKGTNVRPGDMKFKNIKDDENSVNQIDPGLKTLDNPGDMEIIGNSTPRFQYGANLGVNYKGFDLSIFLQGVAKRDVWASGGLTFPFGNGGTFGTLYEGQQDYWKPVDAANGDYTAVNPDAKYHRIYGEMGNNSSNTRTSDKYLFNAAYLRVKNVTLSYAFSGEWMEKAKINRLRVFASFENLFTFTSLPDGFDPERLTWNYPFYRTSSVGLNISF